MSWVSEYLLNNSRLLVDVCGQADRRRLLLDRADAALLAGRLALFDTWAPVEARGQLMVSCEAAIEVGDAALVAGAFGHLAFLPSRTGMHQAAKDYLSLARRYAERSGVPQILSWVGAVEAEILGLLSGDAGLRALDRAIEDLDRPVHACVPAWFDYYSTARLDGFRGQALLSAGQGGAARQALISALDALEPGAVKQRAVLLADLAASGLCQDRPDIDQVATEALRAATELGRTRYRAATKRLVDLRVRLDPWRRTRAVRELDEVMSARAD